MKRPVLNVEFDYDFGLLAIISSMRDYKLCWQINRALHLDLSRKQDLEITNDKKRTHAQFSLYAHEDEINFLRYYFIANKSSGLCLMPEMKQVDYFLMLRGDAAGTLKEELLSPLRLLRGIEAVFETDVSDLDSRQNLILE